MFPDEWPDDCPPADAIAAHGSVYRVVRTNPPGPSDFRSWLELGRPVEGKLCESAGLSTFRAFDDAAHYVEKYPHIGEVIAEGLLEGKHGMVKPTPRRRNSHVTWWPADGVARHELFAVVSS